MNSNYDDVDNLFFEYFEDNKTVPNVITNGIKSALNIQNDKYDIISLIKKVIITIISVLTITGGLVFAKNIKILIENMFGNYNNGITTAIENGYIQDIQMQYIESNNIKVKMDQITMDDYNLGIVFNLNLNGNEYISNLFDIRFKNILIMDENNNIIFAEYENQDDFIKYCEENNLNSGKYNIGYANCGSNGKILNKQDNNIIYSFYTTSEKFPVSQNLSIKFDKIDLLNNKSESIETFTGSWKINIDLEKMQTSRNIIEYSVTNINDNNTTIEKCSLSMSNMRLELITNSNKIDFKKLQTRKGLNVIDMIPFNECYVETFEGKRFFESNSGNNGYDTLGHNKIRYYTTFDYTYFDKAETIKLVLPTNKKKKLIIEMKSNNLEVQ